MRGLGPVGGFSLLAALAGCAAPGADLREAPRSEREVTMASDPSCRDMRTFREKALETPAHPELHAAIERWQPPAPVPPEDRVEIETVARAYLATCGLAETVRLTTELVAFPTVSAEAAPPDHPAFGAMADFLRRWAQENGLTFSVYGAHDVWEVSVGDGPRVLGFVMHADVVPVHAAPEHGPGVTATAAVSLTHASAHPPDWTYPPFEARVVDGRLFGRGTEDDKGPIAAVLVVLKTLKAMGLLPRGEVLAILGTGEEHDWSGMRRYVDARPPPRHVISVDANYPVVIAEAGFVAWSLGIKRSTGDGAAPSSLGPKIVDARGGQFLTQVPGDGVMTVIPRSGETKSALKERLQMLAHEVTTALGPKFSAEVRVEDEGVVVRTHGEAVHSSVADEGANALWPLSEIAARLRPAPTAIAKILELIAARFSGDHHGTKLGLSYSHPLMGKLLVAPTVLRTNEASIVLDVNMRRPAGSSSTAFSLAMDRTLTELRKDVDPRIEELDERYVGDAAVTDLTSALVPTLMSIYQERMGGAPRPVSIRGGTYARLFPGAVSFGPSLPDRPYRGHAPDEYIDLDALDATVQMLLEATLRLAGPAPRGLAGVVQ
ncbi:MAG: M20/M25/M40 family metallo-hydrolase [Deltaproteobacteria bacterium]|nr:M20/M25/M40 family metallo-hydrolase [Deltaproteobacteria bacterium]